MLRNLDSANYNILTHKFHIFAWFSFRTIFWVVRSTRFNWLIKFVISSDAKPYVGIRYFVLCFFFRRNCWVENYSEEIKWKRATNTLCVDGNRKKWPKRRTDWINVPKKISICNSGLAVYLNRCQWQLAVAPFFRSIYSSGAKNRLSDWNFRTFEIQPLKKTLLSSE